MWKVFMLLLSMFASNMLFAYADYCTGQATLSACINGRTGPLTLIIDEPISVSSHTTVPVGITLSITRGGIISVGSGYTLSVYGMIDAGRYQVIAGAGNAYSFNASQEVFPEWFGAIPSDPTDTDDTIAINKAIGFAPDYGTVLFGGGNYLLKAATITGSIPFCTNASIIIDKPIVLKGMSESIHSINPGVDNLSQISYLETTSNCIVYSGEVSDIRIENLLFNKGTTEYNSSESAISFQGTQANPISNIVLNHVRILITNNINSSIGIHLHYTGKNIRVQNSVIEYVGTGRSEAPGIYYHNNYSDTSSTAEALSEIMSEGIEFSNNKISGFKWGFQREGTGGNETKRAKFQGNYISNCDIGASFYHFTGLINNNTFEKNYAGLYIDGHLRGTIVSNNIIRNNDINGANIGDSFDGVFQANSIIDNGNHYDYEKFQDIPGAIPLVSGYTPALPSFGTGLVLGEMAGGIVSGNIILRNKWGIYFNKNPGGGPSLDYNPYNIIISNNSILYNYADGIWLHNKMGRVIKITGNNISNNGMAASTELDSPYGGIRINSDGFSSTSIIVEGNTFQNIAQDDTGENGKQKYGIVSRSVTIGTDGNVSTDAYNSNYSYPTLIAQNNTFEVFAPIYWKYGGRVYLMSNIFLREIYDDDTNPTDADGFTLYTTVPNIRFYHGNVGFWPYTNNL